MSASTKRVGTMGRFVLGRLRRGVLVLLGLTLVVFVLLALSGDPASVMAPSNATVEDVQAIREHYGLDDPLFVQYWHYMANALTGDLGVSWKYNTDALDLVLERTPATAQLAIATFVLSIIVGVGLGVVSAVSRGFFDAIGPMLAIIARSMPTFWLGLMLILFFAVHLGWLPTSGSGSPAHLILPTLTLSAVFIADILLLTRAGMREVLAEEYIRTARAKGLGGAAITWVHALPNAALPIISILGVAFARMIGSAVVTETVFAWPGIGSLAVEGVNARDFPLVQASVLVLAVAVILVSLLTDLCYGWLDPRIRDAAPESRR